MKQLSIDLVSASSRITSLVKSLSEALVEAGSQNVEEDLVLLAHEKSSAKTVAEAHLGNLLVMCDDIELLEDDCRLFWLLRWMTPSEVSLSLQLQGFRCAGSESELSSRICGLEIDQQVVAIIHGVIIAFSAKSATEVWKDEKTIPTDVYVLGIRN